MDKGGAERMGGGGGEAQFCWIGGAISPWLHKSDCGEVLFWTEEEDVVVDSTQLCIKFTAACEGEIRLDSRLHARSFFSSFRHVIAPISVVCLFVWPSGCHYPSFRMPGVLSRAEFRHSANERLGNSENSSGRAVNPKMKRERLAPREGSAFAHVSLKW